jgi:DNA-binding winged helix-turn-helix (wHTH) protein
MTALAIGKQELSAFTSRLGGPNEPGVLSVPPFRLDLAEERLWKGERELRLRRKPFAILRYLAQNPRRLITHSEITEAVWGKIAMSESLLRTHVHDLRRVIGEEIIETVVGRGYRLVANMIHVEDDSSGRRRDEIREAIATGVVRVAGSDETRRLELVRAPAPAPADQIPDATLPLSSPLHVRVLKQVADVLDALGTTAIVVLIVGEGGVRG